MHDTTNTNRTVVQYEHSNEKSTSNDLKPAAKKSRAANEEATLFQVLLSVECAEDCRFVPKPDQAGANTMDDDGRSSSLLYRNVQQWAVGHTCSAIWDEPDDGTVRSVITSWFPEAMVHVISAAGDSEFQDEHVKAQMGAGVILPSEGCVFISIKDADKTADMLEAAQVLTTLGFTFVGTQGTVAWLVENDIPCGLVNKGYEIVI